MTDWQALWDDAGRPVRGHLCEGLRSYQAASTYGCIPNFTEEGATRGCDDENPTPILFCPMCGRKLEAPGD